MVLITPNHHRRLLRELLRGEKEPLDLQAAKELEPDELAQWADDESTRRHIAAVIRLAEAQAQAQIARFRLHAAASLVRLATDGSETVPMEVARKACMDLLGFKLDLAESPWLEAMDDPGEGLDWDRIALFVQGKAEEAMADELEPDACEVEGDAEGEVA